MKKQITFLVLILAMGMIVAGCEKKQVHPGNNQKGDNYQSATTPIKDNDSQILKIVGQNENGWNMYQSDKYGFGLNVPNNFLLDYAKSTGLTSNDIINSFIFQDAGYEDASYKGFVINVYDNCNMNGQIDNNEDLSKIKCCINKNCTISGSGDSVLDFEKLKIDDNNFIKTVQNTGINSNNTVYYFLTKNSIFSFGFDDLSSNLEMEIIKSFKLIKN